MSRFYAYVGVLSVAAFACADRVAPGGASGEAPGAPGGPVTAAADEALILPAATGPTTATTPPPAVLPISPTSARCSVGVPNGASIDAAGMVTLVDGTRYALPACDPTTKGAPPAVDNSWIEGASVTATGSWYTKYTATVTVPAAPVGSFSTGMYNALWGGIEDSARSIVVQPVLFYGYGPDSGGNHWTLECYVQPAVGMAVHSTALTVNPGDSLSISVSATGCNASGGNCTWSCSGTDVTAGHTTSMSDVISQTLNVAWGALLEVENLSTCLDFPTNGPTTFSSVSVYNSAGTKITPSWTISNYTTDQGVPCGFGVTDTSASVSLDYTGWVCTPGDDVACCPYPNGCSCDGDKECNANGKWGGCMGAGQAGHPCP